MPCARRPALLLDVCPPDLRLPELAKLALIEYSTSAHFLVPLPLRHKHLKSQLCFAFLAPIRAAHRIRCGLGLPIRRSLNWDVRYTTSRRVAGAPIKFNCLEKPVNADPEELWGGLWRRQGPENAADASVS